MDRIADGRKTRSASSSHNFDTHFDSSPSPGTPRAIAIVKGP